jgi:D-alanine-D-alanine ligase
MNRESLRNKKIGVLMGGASSERPISLASGNAVLDALLRRGYRAVGVDLQGRAWEQLHDAGIDVAFIALHGRWGEDGTVQGLLEIMAIPYTGSGVLGSAAAMDKCMMKLLLEALGVPTPGYAVYQSKDRIDFPLPFIVKPAREGSTIGVSIVREEGQIEKALSEALHYDPRVLVEQYIQGKEITVGIVNGQTLPLIEVRPGSGFYDFTAKYTKGMTEYVVPAEVSSAVTEKASGFARVIWDGFQLSGCARVDMMVNGDVPEVIDINTSPGMTETSLVPKAWAHLGKTFDLLVEEILLEAALRA